MGHDVTMIAGDYSHLRSKNPDVLRDFQKSNIDGIRYVWLKTGQYEGNGVKRAMTMKRFVSKLYMSAGKIADRFSPDVVISSSTYPLDTYPARRIAKKAGAKLIQREPHRPIRAATDAPLTAILRIRSRLAREGCRRSGECGIRWAVRCQMRPP